MFPDCRLVDSRDIVELQLKQLDFEVIIRKKEALPQPPVPAPVPMMQAAPPPVAPAAPASSSAPSSPPATFPAPSSPNAKSAKTSLPPLKCPMAGTFYRSPAPGEPPFVKVFLLYLEFYLQPTFLSGCLSVFIAALLFFGLHENFLNRLGTKYRRDKSCVSLRP